MALAGIYETTNPQVKALLETSTFTAKPKQGVQKQLQPTQLEDLRKIDLVSLSDKALQLSREALTPESPVKETKQE